MTPDNAKVIMDFLADGIERESATTKKVLAAVPAGKEEYTPAEKSMKALELAWHIASAEQMFMAGIASGSFETGGNKRPDSITSGAQVAAWYGEETSKNVAKLRALTPDQCARVIDFHGVWQMPGAAWAQLSLTHAIHHRGQLSAYLRPMGAKVPGIYGPSADEPLKA